MSIFCLCTATTISEPNTARADNIASVVMPEHPMKCIKTGATQMIRWPDGKLTTHYPNVDIFYCEKCGARVAR